MTKRTEKDTPELASGHRLARSVGALTGAAVAIALTFSGCASGGSGRWVPALAGAEQPAVNAAPEAPAVTAPRLIAVIPPSKPLGVRAILPAADSAQPISMAGRAIAATGYLWPVQGRVVRAFGSEPDGRRCDGLDITAAEGTPVLAAEAGIVAYAGDEIQGYGNMLLIEHAGGFTTVYAHNRKLLVHVGDPVRRGEVVATVGRSGGMADPQLHFQLRAGNTPIDPKPYLVRGATILASASPADLSGRPGE